MILCTCTLKSASPISFSRKVQSAKNTGENDEAFEARTWRERLHVNEHDEVFIPPTALKNCLAEVAKYLSESVPGKGKSTFTKHFEAGTIVSDPIMLGIKGKDVVGETLYVPSNGQRGGGKRVNRTFPFIPTWTGTASVYVLDPVLVDKPQKIEEYLKHAGQFIGLGRFRPRNNGFYGRFTVENFQHKTV